MGAVKKNATSLALVDSYAREAKRKKRLWQYAAFLPSILIIDACI
jgi:hypothetical protein